MTGLKDLCFKPYYKWIIFNITDAMTQKQYLYSFKPYYKWIIFNIYGKKQGAKAEAASFKPYYKWIIFNIKMWIY